MWILAITIIIILRILISLAISKAIEPKFVPAPIKKAFWWVFLFGLLGTIIYILLTIRDSEKII